MRFQQQSIRERESKRGKFCKVVGKSPVAATPFVQEPKCSYLCDTFSAGGKALLEGGQEYRNTFRLQEVRRMSQKTVSPRWPTRIVCIQRMGGYRLTTCWCPNEKDELS